ncbi:trypsin-like serine protease [Staphylococcus hyicus]|uniref:Serine protease n=2 Tax=Staphylococcus hyicus TaxID=1284 RepID=Q8GNJ4_STAHY|nr:trypsin-like peptidase domain-containing protein [Staphylococcus hyicus]AAN32973.1 exfoliative toxin ExhD [Staphylococcus hyicus]ALN39181.1 ExhD [Staphylococcus hyicus]MCQ9299534.1 trypsin-like serine protease [Staphylococcus hyicus]
MKNTLLKKTLILLTLTAVAPMSLQALESPIKNNVYASDLSEQEHIEKWNKYNGRNPLGQDYFKKVENTKEYPYQAVGSIFIKQKTVATASVVGKNKIITNYHIAKQAENDPSKVIFRPGLTTDENGVFQRPFGEFTAKSIEEAPFGAGLELAIITLNPNEEGKEIGEVVKPLELGNANAVEPRQKLSLIGYPNEHVQNKMFNQEIEVLSTKNGLKYFGYTESGNSGSPILDGDNSIVGIHVGKSGFDDKRKFLIGTLFDGNLPKLLKEKLNK